MKPVTDDPATMPSDRRRFEAKVTKSGPVAPHMHSRCWTWNGAVDARGHPRFWLRGNSVTAQRADDWDRRQQTAISWQRAVDRSNNSAAGAIGHNFGH